MLAVSIFHTNLDSSLKTCEKYIQVFQNIQYSHHYSKMTKYVITGCITFIFLTGVRHF